MALQFPSNPTDGQIYTENNKTFIYSGTRGYWIPATLSQSLGSLSTSIVPDTDVTYDLGSSTNKFRDLYLSGNTLVLGDTSISASDGELSVTSPSNPTPAPVGGGSSSTFTTVDDLVVGDAVQIRTDGTVEKIVGTGSLVTAALPAEVSGQPFHSNSHTTVILSAFVYDHSDPNTAFMIYQDRTNGNHVNDIDYYGVVVTRSGYSWTAGTAIYLKDYASAMVAKWSHKVDDKILVSYYGGVSNSNIINNGLYAMTLDIDKSNRSFTISYDVQVTSATYIMSDFNDRNVDISTDDVLAFTFKDGNYSYIGYFAWDATTGAISNATFNQQLGYVGGGYYLRCYRIPGWSEADIPGYGDLFLSIWQDSYFILYQLFRIRPGGTGSAAVGSATNFSVGSNNTIRNWDIAFDGNDKTRIFVSMGQGYFSSDYEVDTYLLTIDDDLTPTGFTPNPPLARAPMTGDQVVVLSDRYQVGSFTVIARNRTSGNFEIEYSNGVWDYDNNSCTFSPKQQIIGLSNMDTYLYDYSEDQNYYSVFDQNRQHWGLQLNADTRDTNMITDRVLGIVSSDALSGETVNVDLRGSSTEALTGLNPTASYYIQIDGSISDVNSNGSFEIGKAISSGKMLLKGI